MTGRDCAIALMRPVLGSVMTATETAGSEGETRLLMACWAASWVAGLMTVWIVRPPR